MSKVDRLLNRGIDFTKQGRSGNARQIFKAIIHEQPRHPIAWRWYIQTFDEPDQRIRAFDQYLAVFPGDQSARQAQANLLRKQHRRWKQQAFINQNTNSWLQRDREQEFQKGQQALNRIKTIFTASFLISFLIICIASSLSVNRIDALSQQLNESRRQLAIVKLAHQLLNTEYQSLQSNFLILSAENDHLTESYDSLLSEYNDLTGQYNTLVNQYNDLTNQYGTLAGEYDWLESISITPPYIVTNGRMVKLAFYKIDGSITYWDVPFDALEYDLARGNSLRNEISQGRGNHFLKLSNTNTDEEFFAVDMRPFISSADFKDVVRDLYNQAPDEDAFIREVWNIVAQLTTYSSEVTDTPRFPLETLLAGGGDCEDTAILLASMLAAAPTNWEIDLLYMDGNNPTRPLEMNHVAIYVTMPNKSYTIETTSKSIMEPYINGVSGWYFDIEE